MKKTIALAFGLITTLLIYPQDEILQVKSAHPACSENPEKVSLVPDSNSHFLSIFVMKSVKPIDWESPSTLVRSTFKGYKARLFHPRQYLLGHMAVRLESPLVGGIKYSAMVSTSMREKRVLILKDKVGLAILGMAMNGKLDDETDIYKDLTFSSRKNKLAYVKYQISEESARRIILFMEGFNSSVNDAIPPSNYYGGAFWPRYFDEGSGCSAYGMAMIDVAGLTGTEHNDWKIVVNIPLRLVGGELNQGKKVPKKEISNAKSWVSDNDVDQEYIHFSIYDPSLIYEWILEQRNNTGDGYYINEQESEIPGLFSDKTYIRPSVLEPVFIPRPEPSLFIEHYKRNRGN